MEVKQIGDQDIDPGQNLGRLLPLTGDQPLMTEIERGIKEAMALPTIGFDHRLGGCV